jgi:hypothetical protein
MLSMQISVGLSRFINTQPAWPTQTRQFHCKITVQWYWRLVLCYSSIWLVVVLLCSRKNYFGKRYASRCRFLCHLWSRLRRRAKGSVCPSVSLSNYQGVSRNYAVHTHGQRKTISPFGSHHSSGKVTTISGEKSKPEQQSADILRTVLWLLPESIERPCMYG